MLALIAPLALAAALFAVPGLRGVPAASAQEAPAPAQEPEAGFSFDVVRERARQLAQQDYAEPAEDDLPEWLAKLDYDGYHRLRFRQELAHWAGDGLPFRLIFAHRGYLFRGRVILHEVEGGRVRELRYSPAQFRSPEDQPALPEDLGYAGFAIRWAGAGETATWDEVAAFLGASYFRLIGTGQVYGASARGLAIDTATPQGDEFPRFVEFWIERPAPDAAQLTLHALLDTPALAGAFRFVLTPGAETSAEVTACLFPRHAVDKLGLAPLTSMFLFGEDGLHRMPDYRPEVHDSDGLLIDDGRGEWTWRPLNNPPQQHRITRFALESPAGFGLMQRDRSFRSYEDLGARFETRPSYWVAPRGAWGKGWVELVEIPTPAEWNDNIVAFWVPEEPLAVGVEHRVEYTVTAQVGRARATRVRPDTDVQLFVLAFEGPPPQPGDEPLRTEVASTAGTVRDVTLQPNEIEGGHRCAFQLVDAGREPLELRVRMFRGERPVSETLVLHWATP